METTPPAETTKDVAPNRSRRLLLFGVLWPLFTIGLELATRACRGTFFDPLPTWVHVLLTLCVPATCWVAWRRSYGEDSEVKYWHRLLLGFAWFVSSFYTLCFFHLSWLAVIGCVFSPFLLASGSVAPLLPFATLGPVLSWLTLWKARKFLSGRGGILHWQPWAGAVTALGLLMVVEMPFLLSNWSLQSFTPAASVQTKATVVGQMRSWDNESLLRSNAYGNPTTAASPGSWLSSNPGFFFGNRNINSADTNVEAARDLYFRVYGRLFTDMPPPLAQSSFFGLGESENSREGVESFVWDEERGGDLVGARLRGLSLHTSRMDWHMDAASSLAYGEWTLEFHNQHSNAQEARCQMLLPPEAFVSRLTLWVNGEPKEAAFDAKAKVKAAYQQVVVRDQRDPVMVNMVGPDRILTQCFPVPPGGIMKIRLGVTAPLSEGQLHLPLFIERNFSIPPGLKHALWVQSSTAFKAPSEGNVLSEGRQYSWRQEVPQADILGLKFSLEAAAPSTVIWTEDPHEKTENRFVVARREAQQPFVPTRVIFVVDASVALRPWATDLGKAISSVASKVPIQVFLATDSGFQEMPPDQAALPWAKNIFAGGRDNSAALAHVFDLARQSGAGAAVVWLHGPQPFEFPEVQTLNQILERSTRPPALHAIALVQGPNRLLENLYRHAQVRTQGRCQDLSALEQALQTALGQQSVNVWSFTRQATAPTEPEAVKVWDHLVRQAVFQEVLAGYQSGEDSSRLAQLAAKHQLVTAVSGAVVLETQAQYDRAGLKPVDPNSTPQIPTGVVPEPSTAFLIIFGLAASFWRRRRMH